MKSKLNIGIAASLVAAIALIALLLVVVKPSARAAANEWKRAEGAKLLEEKRAAELLDAQGRILWETAFLAKEAGPDSAAVVRVIQGMLPADTTGLKATRVGTRLSLGWPEREIHFTFAKGALKELDLSALTGAVK